MKRKSIYKMMGKTAFVLSAITMFGGCGTKDTSTESSNPIVTMETVATESEDTQASDEVIESVDTKVSDEEKYYMDMSVHAAAFTILATEWKTMINHIEPEAVND